MPKWLDNAVFYEIYPQSFRDANGDGIGDFAGISEKLDYIRELGCNALWINPCFLSPFGDAGYDVADYYTTAPRYGTNEDLKQLLEKAHSLGFHVLLDLVPGHTSIEHPWFKESQKPEKNEYSDRYIWTNRVWEAPGGMGCLRGLSQRNGACALNFFTTQPALNYGYYEITRPWQMSPDDEAPVKALEAMMDVMRFWLDLGCDGFRVDMASSLVKNDPESKGTMALWRKVRAFLDKEYPEAAIISEWGEPEKAIIGGFHMDFQLHFGPSHYNDLFRLEHPFFSADGKGDAAAFVSKYMESYTKIKGRGLMCIPTGNHDMPRLARKLPSEQLKLAYLFQMTMPGAPYIYYGDEIGMRQGENLISVEGAYDRTGARTPMQWDSGVNAGFSAAAKHKLYLPIDPESDRPNVAAQKRDPDSVYSHVKALISLRHSIPALQSWGDIQFVYAEDHSYPLAYERTDGTDIVLVVLNPSADEVSFPYDKNLGELLYQLGGRCSLNDGVVAIAPVSGAAYKIKQPI